jgi:hypothetical protein
MPDPFEYESAVLTGEDEISEEHFVETDAI